MSMTTGIRVVVSLRMRCRAAVFNLKRICVSPKGDDFSHHVRKGGLFWPLVELWEAIRCVPPVIAIPGNPDFYETVQDIAKRKTKGARRRCSVVISAARLRWIEGPVIHERRK